MKTRDPVLYVATALLIAGLIIITVAQLTGCGTAEGDGAYAVSFPGPDGNTCYAIYAGGRAVGGNCK